METDRKVRRHHFAQPCWCINHHGWFTQPSRKGRSMSLNAGEQVQGILWDHLTCTFLYPATMKSFPHPTPLFSLNHSVWGCGGVHAHPLNHMHTHCGTREGQRTSSFSPSTTRVLETAPTQVVRLGSTWFYRWASRQPPTLLLKCLVILYKFK